MRVSWLWALPFLPLGASAEERAQPQPPQLEIIEFLGEWEDANDGWLDPAELDLDWPQAERQQVDGIKDD